MNFLNLIQHELCGHLNNISLQPGSKLYCTVCRKTILDVCEYIQIPFEDNFYSSAVAQSYYEWTKDDQIPLTFTLVDLEGILPKRIQGQTLSRIRECIELLRAINAPFTSNPSFYISESMKTFLIRYLGSLSIHKLTNQSTEEKMLNQIIRGMHQAIQSEEFSNPFELYFDKLVPYVQHCVSPWTPLPEIAEDANFAKELLIQLQRSAMIRKVFGIHSIPFDVIHVLLGCYVCSSDLEMVGNWALDLMARICRGQYFWKSNPKCIFVRKMTRLLETNITFKKRTQLYHVIREIQRGNAAESLSAFWPHFLQLQKWVSENFNVPNVSSNILQIASNQMFPAVLFEKHSDQLGFTMALGHLILSVDHKTGQMQKGSFKKARQIHEIVRKFIESVEKFESIPISWTLDTLRIFLLSEPNLEKEIVETMRYLFINED